MKINEIANPSDALWLWRLISDNTWAALELQAQQEAQAKAAKAKAKKPSKRKPRKSSAAAAKPVVLKPTPLPKVDPVPSSKAQDSKPQAPNAQASTPIAAVPTGPLPSKKNWDLWPKPASLAAQPSAAVETPKAVRTRGEQDAEQDSAATALK
jgi:hypothetical protein